MLADIVHEQGANSTPIVCGCDGAVALLTSSVPDLGFDGFIVDLDAARGELHSDSGLAIKIELVARETREQVRFSDAAVSYEYDLEEILQKTGKQTSVYAPYASQPRSKCIMRDLPYIVFVVRHVGP